MKRAAAVRTCLAVTTLALTAVFNRPVGAQALPLESARVMPRGTGEAALFQPSRVGLGHDLELDTRLLLIGLMPNLGLRFQWLDSVFLTGALRLQLTYPSLLLRTLAREGAGGLLPPSRSPAETVMCDLRALHTFHTEWGGLNLVAGVEVAPRRSGAGNQALLDFPFLYPRFAALHRDAVIRLSASFEAELPHGLGYSVDLTSFSLLGKGGGHALELGASLRYALARHLIVELGLRAAHSRLPVGVRWHYLPWLDFRFPWSRS